MHIYMYVCIYYHFSLAAVRLLKDIEVKGTAGVMKTGGSTLSSGGGGQHYVQDKVFVGLTQVAENFDLKEKLQGTAVSV